VTNLTFRLPAGFPYVDAGTWPAAGQDHLVWLTERQMSIIRQMVYPRCLADSAFCVPVYPGVFREGDQFDRLDFNDEVQDLLSKLNTEEAMTDTELQAIIEGAAMAVVAPMPWITSFGKTDLAAGPNNGTLYTAPAYNRVIVKHVAFYVVSTTIAEVRLYAEIGGVLAVFSQVATPAHGVRQLRDVHIVLAAGDKLTYALTGATLNDSLYVQAIGYVQAFPIEIEG